MPPETFSSSTSKNGIAKDAVSPATRASSAMDNTMTASSRRMSSHQPSHRGAFVGLDCEQRIEAKQRQTIAQLGVYADETETAALLVQRRLGAQDDTEANVIAVHAALEIEDEQMIPCVNQLIHLLAELGVVIAVHSPADADDHHRPVQYRMAVRHDEALADRGIHVGCTTL